jgi:hypothetical protein
MPGSTKSSPAKARIGLPLSACRPEKARKSGLVDFAQLPRGFFRFCKNELCGLGKSLKLSVEFFSGGK